MSDNKQRFESLMFDYQTTNRTDFRNGEIKPVIKTEYKAKPVCYRVRPPPLQDVHALTDWRLANVPSFLFVTPKAITGTNPWDVQKPYAKPVDLQREEVQKTRPRLIMTPAVSLDDIEDKECRKLLIDGVYETYTKKAMREAARLAVYNNVQAPFPGLPAPANPIFLPKLQAPYVSPEWRMESVAWDNKQLRGHCDTTKEFWLKQPLPKCKACDETATVERQRKMRPGRRSSLKRYQ